MMFSSVCLSLQGFSELLTQTEKLNQKCLCFFQYGLQGFLQYRLKETNIINPQFKQIGADSTGGADFGLESAPIPNLLRFEVIPDLNGTRGKFS